MKRTASAPVLDPETFSNKEHDMLFPLYNDKAVTYQYPKVTLLEGLKLSSIKEGDNVLILSYISTVLLALFNYLGIKMKYYPVNSDLIDNRTKAVMAVLN